MFNQEEPEKYYGFHFMDDNNNFKLSQTYLPVNQLELKHLLSDGVDYSRDAEFKVLFGFIKELTLVNGKVVINSPSKVGGEKYQAFIFKRKGETVNNEGSDFFVNGKKIDFNFIQYNVSIVEVDNFN